MHRRSVQVIQTNEAEQHLPAWQQTFRGLRWSDMPPQKASDIQKLNFALFRRGLYDPDLDVVAPEVAELESDEEAAAKPKLITTEDGRLLRRRNEKKKSPFVRALRVKRGPRPITVEGMDKIAMSRGRTEDGRPVGKEIAAWIAQGGGRTISRICRIVDTGMGTTLTKMARGGKCWLRPGTSDKIRDAMRQGEEQLRMIQEEARATDAMLAEVQQLLQRVRATGCTENYMCRLANIHGNTIYRLKTGVKMKLETLKQLRTGLKQALKTLNKPALRRHKQAA